MNVRLKQKMRRCGATAKIQAGNDRNPKISGTNSKLLNKPAPQPRDEFRGFIRFLCKRGLGGFILGVVFDSA
jgi:hypothetical protein